MGQHVSLRNAVEAVMKSAMRFVALMVAGRILQPRRHVGGRLVFADGTTARVFRETTVRDAPPTDLAVLVVEFRLRWVHGFMHRLFRWESLLNTPLFVGFPGFVSKLWLAHDEHEVYRGIYQWSGPERAEAYAMALSRLLQPVCVRGSIAYHILPGLDRAEFVSGREELVRTQRIEHGAESWVVA
ncbi:hypothetical protein [Antrihabitans sp. YC2-6]|uniref:hypothetical protein n=1 Tax=Antrihabitans sp. YC2-6 TaxID=2799498 RepID=UPI0018F79D06|nr:hypothetical protein [Antrihabitans sp. YC2-6]MBJ8347044.1 hypothetical protein [Antrihabitans sp. YC2-6]